jgi:hypothetical protein
MPRKGVQYVYPKFTIRLSEEELQELKTWVESIHRKLNKGRDPKGERAITRSNIALTALRVGLDLIDRKQIEPKPKGADS